MKTAGRQQRSSAARPPFKAKTAGHEPDRIIMPLNDAREPTLNRYMARMNAAEYTDYEEVTSSCEYDELAFQDYAGDDPARLRVIGSKARA